MAFAKRKKPQSSEIPTDSVSDIAFLLIIFFILTTTIRKLTGFSTELPAADKMATTTQTDTTPTIVLTEETITWGDSKVTMDELRAKLKELKLGEKAPTDPKKVILMEPAAGIQYQRYYEVMSSISAAGGVVGILMEEEGGGQAK
jgi:biopolymer transport protein ExbD